MKLQIDRFLLKLKDLFISFFKKIKYYYNQSKKNKPFYIISIALFLCSNILYVISKNYTFDAKIENISYKISYLSKNNDYKTVNLNIIQQEIDGKKIIESNRSYKHTAGQVSHQYLLNATRLCVNSKIDNYAYISFSADEEIKTSILFPTAFSSSQYRDNDDGVIRYKMDDYNLFYKFNNP